MNVKKMIFLLVLLLLIPACKNSESEARRLLNQALMDWQDGKIEESIKKFDLITTSYQDTESATVALSKKPELIEKFKFTNSAQNRIANQGGVGRYLIRNIENYHQINKKFPHTIKDVLSENSKEYEKYATLCQYKVIMEYGYQLDCSQAEASFEKDRKKEIAFSVKSRQLEQSESIDFSSPPVYPKANTTWGTDINPSGETPKRGFFAFYFNSQNPSVIVDKETVNDISINYIYDEFRGIQSEDFACYWVGTVSTDITEVKQIAINRGQGKARIIIDGNVVYENGNNEILYSFTPGTHRIEVEYINNWHTTEFSVRILPKINFLTHEEIAEKIQPNLPGACDIYFVGVYESPNKDLSIALEIVKNSHPVVLVLNSYSPIKWQISNPNRVEIRAVIYSSYSPGTQIVGDIPPQALILATKKGFGTGAYQIDQKCYCISGHYNCEGKDFFETKSIIEKIVKMPVTGFSGKYSTASLQVPEIRLTDAFFAEIKKKAEENESLKKSCNKESNPDFEQFIRPSQQ